MIPLIGWFDERFTTGYYEDNDWQLRISESGPKDRVSFDKNECLIRNRPSGRHRWDSAENFWWIRDKWNNADHWGQPSFRQVGEQYLYPMTMKEYEERFNIESRIPLINETMVKNGIGVFH
jgi:GT2 family glycosyltransferase